VDLGDWSIRHWRLLSSLTTALLVVVCGMAGALTSYNGAFPALGGLNGLLYDLTLKIAEPWRRDSPTAPAVFVAVDDASLSHPELANLPRPLFQPIWARLIDELLEAGARQIAFDVVFAYSGSEFQIGSYKLPDYDRSLIASLEQGRDRIVLGRFPSIAPAAPFAKAVGPSRVGVLDLRVESDGRVRSTAPLLRLPNGRIALSFAALGAGLSVRQAASAERILIAPTLPLAETPTYSLETLLSCLSSPEGTRQVRAAVENRIVVVGTAVIGEDEHRGPTRFLGRASPGPAGDRCAPHSGLFQRPAPDQGPGALLQIAAIQSAASDRPIVLAEPWLRFVAGASLALIFAILAFQEDSALTVGERDVTPASAVLMQLTRSVAIGLAGPALVGLLVGAAALILADRWLPMAYPIVATNIAFGIILSERSIRHRAYFRRLYRTAGRYLPPARLVSLAREGFADPAEGQERELSILLVDLVGFTSFSNRPDLTASEIVRVANNYFTVMHEAIDRHHGCSDKFLGDSVLAFWNGFSDEPDHALRAVAAAMEIIGAVESAVISSHHRLAARAVVCSGRVYVGDLGAKRRSNFTIIGPAVNETFRLEKVPDLYGLPLLVSASTADLILSAESTVASTGVLAANVLIRVDDVALKGFDKPESVHALVAKDDPGLPEFLAGRKALDEQMHCEGLAHLKNVDRGVLQQAAKVISERYRTS
jgi:adenylate cyclase